jgi:hypothetical protein
MSAPAGPDLAGPDLVCSDLDSPDLVNKGRDPSTGTGIREPALSRSSFIGKNTRGLSHFPECGLKRRIGTVELQQLCVRSQELLVDFS